MHGCVDSWNDNDLKVAWRCLHTIDGSLWMDC
jgi:hypothetical protein